MLQAFVSRGLQLKLDEIKYYAQGKDNAIEALTGISGRDSDLEVTGIDCDCEFICRLAGRLAYQMPCKHVA